MTAWHDPDPLATLRYWAQRLAPPLVVESPHVEPGTILAIDPAVLTSEMFPAVRPDARRRFVVPPDDAERVREALARIEAERR